MIEQPRIVPVMPPSRGPRRASIMTVAVIVLVALAIAKPWTLVATGSPEGPAADPIPASANPATNPGDRSAIPTAPSGDPNAMACLAGETEQLLTIERSAGREVRSWIAVPRIAAAGPLDPRLVPLTIFSSRVVGLGVCAARTDLGALPPGGPSEAGGGSAATLLDVRSITNVAGGAAAIDLGPPSLLPDALNRLDPALLYGPPHPAEPASSASPGPPTKSASADLPSGPSPSPGLPTWRAGSYAIAFRFGSDDVTVVRWLRVELLTGAGGGA